jgi:hypothetical protein
VQPTFTVVNGVGMQDPDESARVKAQKEAIEKLFNERLIKQQEIEAKVDGALSDFVKSMQILELVSAIGSLGTLNFNSQATADPLLDYVFCSYLEGEWGEGGNEWGDGGKFGTNSAIGVELMEYQVSFYMKGEVRIDKKTGDWNLQVVEGGVAIKIGISVPLMNIAVPVLFIPIYLSINFDAGIEMAVQF